MILSLKIKNFLSFKDEVEFSFEATKDKYLGNYHIVEVAKGVRIGKIGIVYGANASGKSNLIKAFEFIKSFWFNTTESKDYAIDVIPFLLDNDCKNKPSEFVLTFYTEGVKHIYTLKLTEKNVIEESLIYYTSARPSEIFSRQLIQNTSKIKFNSKLAINSVATNEIELKCLTNMSVFSAYSKVNISLPEMERAILWMKDNFMPVVEPKTRLMNFVETLLMKDSTFKPYLLDFLKKADFNICNVDTKKEKEPIPDGFWEFIENNNDFPKEEKERLKNEKTITVTETSFTHKVLNDLDNEANYDLPESLQSEGTLRTMGLAGVINKAINKNAFLAIDEIESSLHPLLVEFIIENFLKQASNAQLLLTTHYDGLLESNDLLRNDNIWFTSKKKDGSTELFSLSDFNGVNRITSLKKAYKYGKFGAIPNI